MLVAGVDLAVKRPTAVALLEDCSLYYIALVETDEEIIEAVSKARVVAIDAPLSKPPGGRGLRDVERALRAMGLRILPPMMGAMRLLTERGIKISRGVTGEVIEVHPLSSLKAMGLARGDVGAKYGVGHRDIIDAIAAALTAIAYLRGLYVKIGPLVLPTARVCI